MLDMAGRSVTEQSILFAQQRLENNYSQIKFGKPVDHRTFLFSHHRDGQLLRFSMVLFAAPESQEWYCIVRFSPDVLGTQVNAAF